MSLCDCSLFRQCRFLTLGGASSLGRAMAGLEAKLDDRDAFANLLERWCVPPEVRQKLQDSGFCTIALLAHALPGVEHLEDFLENLLGRAPGSDPTTPVFSPQAAALRRLVKECLRLAEPGSPAVPTSPLGAAAKNRLQSADVAKLVAEFGKKYPSELLSPDLMPSLSFLNLVKEAVDANQICWISWRLRTSQADEEAFTEKRRPRTDSAMLQALLTPAQDDLMVDVPRHLPLESVVRRYLDRMSVALALLDACHLLALKKFAEKFAGLATAVPIDRSLRGPSLAEAMDADRVIWSAVAALQREYGWSLHDCISEITHIRSDMHNALAPRPKSVAPGAELKNKRPRADPPPAPHPNARPAKVKKSGEAGGKGAKPNQAKRVSVSNWPDNWARQIGGVGACIRFHTDKCKNKQCRFSHKCPILGANGAPCGADHSAKSHSSASH